MFDTYTITLLDVIKCVPGFNFLLLKVNSTPKKLNKSRYSYISKP